MDEEETTGHKHGAEKLKMLQPGKATDTRNKDDDSGELIGEINRVARKSAELTGNEDDDEFAEILTDIVKNPNLTEFQKPWLLEDFNRWYIYELFLKLRRQVERENMEKSSLEKRLINIKMQNHQNKEDGKFAGKEDQTDLFKKEIEDLQQKLRERDLTIDRMEGEIGVRTRQTEQLQNRLIEDERRSNHLERERDRYAKLLEEKESQIRYFEKEPANRNKKLDRLRKELETLRNEMDKTKDNLQEKVEMIDEMLEYNGRIENEYERKLRENEVQKLEEDKEIEYWKKEAMIVKKELKLTKEELQEENTLRKNLEIQLNQMKREAIFRDVIGHLTEEESKDEIERKMKETQDMIHRLNEEMELNRIKDSKIQQLKEEKLEKDIANEYWEKETLKIEEVLKETKSELQLEKTVRKVLEEELNLAKQDAEELRQDKLRAKTRADNVEKLFEEVEMMIERKANELKIVEEEKETLKGKLIKEENREKKKRDK
ncbi:uncharacterized protein MCAP_0864-like [Palaemon carinicauda]|uniref:uncharacterized protein MCAP_0864-like n=1 Tax=Palaemon carinicauda TaxID=392227 RepID=UPI0035B59B5D